MKCFSHLATALLVWTCSSFGGLIQEKVVMRDGVRLATDVHLPQAGDRHPAVLIRTPYDKSAPGMLKIVPEANRRGYALVVQDTRGRYESEGKNRPFIGEGIEIHEDGVDTIRWIEKQPWANGKVGTYGGSALGISQVLMADSAPSPLVCQHVSVAPGSFYHDFVYSGGIFKKHLIEFWLGSQKFESDVLQEWQSHPSYDSYWEKRNVLPGVTKSSRPAVHIGGYYDIFAQGTVDLFQAFQEGKGGANRQKLVLGPWTHVVLIEWSGELRFPNGNQPPNQVHDHWRWFDHFLKGIDNGIDREPAVTYYVMGATDEKGAAGNRWRTSASWPPPFKEKPLYLNTEKELVSRPVEKAGSLDYLFDPENPAPTLGGLQFFTGITAGSKNQRELESRDDVVTFTSVPLEEPLEIAGNVEVELWVSIDSADADVFVKLCDVYPDGRSYNVAEGQLRLKYRTSFATPEAMPGNKALPIRIVLSPTSIAFEKNHRVRLQVTSGSDPGFAVNPGNGDDFPGKNPTRKTTVRLHTGGEHPSRMVLPVTVF